MIFVTDDHRVVRLSRDDRPSQGVVPELDDPMMQALVMPSSKLSKRVTVTVEQQKTKTAEAE